MAAKPAGKGFIRLEVIAPIPTAFRHCVHCEQVMDAQIGARVRLEMVQEYPSEFLEAFDRLMAWIDEITARFGPDLQVRVVDPQSPEGLWKCLRYGVRRYPAFIVQGRRRAVGWDWEAVEQALDEAWAAR
ncbi:MAG TPA: hypothetical protein EYH30_10165 [Anaerolineales bacterium]|nr:hypothetical protein [Anaerolineales bacterium]